MRLLTTIDRPNPKTCTFLAPFRRTGSMKANIDERDDNKEDEEKKKQHGMIELNFWLLSAICRL